MVVDGGAHIGVLTVLLASLCPAGHVYTFEPAAASHEHLIANVATNDMENVIVEAAALYDSDGEIVFDFDAAFPAGSHVGSTGNRVPSFRMDTSAHRAASSGSTCSSSMSKDPELAVLAGAHETIRRFRPTTIVECNPVALRRFGNRSYRELFDAMKSLFHVVAVLSANGAVIPLLSATHLDLVLADEGVIDLVGMGPRSRTQTALAFGRLAATCCACHASTTGNDRPRTRSSNPTSASNRASPTSPVMPTRSSGRRSRSRTRTRWWMSSDFPYHPVHASYRLLDEDGAVVVSNGHRTPLPAPPRRAAP